MGSVLPGVPKTSLLGLWAVWRALAYVLGIRGWGVWQVDREVGHSPVLLTDMDCTWTYGVCQSWGAETGCKEDDEVGGLGANFFSVSYEDVFTFSARMKISFNSPCFSVSSKCSNCLSGKSPVLKGWVCVS